MPFSLKSLWEVRRHTGRPWWPTAVFLASSLCFVISSHWHVSTLSFLFHPQWCSFASNPPTLLIHLSSLINSLLALKKWSLWLMNISAREKIDFNEAAKVLKSSLMGKWFNQFSQSTLWEMNQLFSVKQSIKSCIVFHQTSNWTTPNKWHFLHWNDYSAAERFTKPNHQLQLNLS